MTAGRPNRAVVPAAGAGAWPAPLGPCAERDPALRAALNLAGRLRVQFARYGALDRARLQDALLTLEDRGARLTLLRQVLTFAPYLEPDLCRLVAGHASAADVVSPAFQAAHPHILPATRWALAIGLATGPGDAAELADRMRIAGVRPGIFTFGQRIHMAPTLAEAAAILGQMRAQGFAPDPALYLSLIGKAKGVTAALILMDEMCDTGVRITEQHVWAIGRTCRTVADLIAVSERMTTLGAPVSWRLLGLVPRFRSRFADKLDLAEKLAGPGATVTADDVRRMDEIAVDLALLEAALARTVWPDAAARDARICALIRDAQSPAAAQLLFDVCLDEGVLPTEALYTALATRGETAGGILRLADRMRADGVDPGIGYFAAALQRADTTPARCRILTAMRSSRVDIPSHTIVDLIARAPNFADATAVYDEMQRIGVTEVSPLFRALSDRVRHYADAQWLLEEMRLAGREAPVEVLTLAAMQAPHFAATAQAVAAVADRSGALPATIFDRWLAQARSFEEGRQVLNRAAHCGLPPSLDRLRAWLALARTLDQVRDVVDRRAGVPDPGGVAPDLFAHTPGLARTLRDVVRSTGRCAAAGAALRALRGWGATISQDLIDEAARLAHSHREVLVLGHDLQAQGVAPGARLFQIAFDHAATYPEWMLILREMADCGLRPRRPMLTVLKRAAHSADEVLAVAELWMSGGCTLLAEDLEEIEATLAGDPDAAAAWDRLRKSPIFLAEAPRDTVVGPTAASG